MSDGHGHKFAVVAIKVSSNELYFREQGPISKNNLILVYSKLEYIFLLTNVDDINTPHISRHCSLYFYVTSVLFPQLIKLGTMMFIIQCWDIINCAIEIKRYSVLKSLMIHLL